MFWKSNSLPYSTTIYSNAYPNDHNDSVPNSYPHSIALSDAFGNTNAHSFGFSHAVGHPNTYSYIHSVSVSISIPNQNRFAVGDPYADPNVYVDPNGNSYDRCHSLAFTNHDTNTVLNADTDANTYPITVTDNSAAN